MSVNLPSGLGTTTGRSMAEEDDEQPQLSVATLAALREWIEERQGQEEDKTDVAEDGAVDIVAEDWRLSQFWYDAATAATVAEELHHLSKAFNSPRIACVACPSLYVELKNKHRDVDAHLFEYDRRFAKYGDDFSFYDYNSPQDVPKECQGAFQVIVADPPYLSEECLLKTVQTMKHLAAEPEKSIFLLLTGAIQKERVAGLLHAYPCKFRPQHQNKLGNEFMLFVNYDPGHRLGGLETFGLA